MNRLLGLTTVRRSISSIGEAVKVLQIHPDKISLGEIKSAYYEQSKAMHPDKNPGVDTTAKFARLNKAYEFALAHIDKFEKNQSQRAERRGVRPVTLKKGFGSRGAFDNLTMPQGYTPTQTTNQREKAMAGRWTPKEGTRETAPVEKPKSTYGLTDDHKYVKPDRTINYKAPKSSKGKNRQESGRKTGDGFFDSHQEYYTH